MVQYAVQRKFSQVNTHATHAVAKFTNCPGKLHNVEGNLYRCEVQRLGMCGQLPSSCLSDLIRTMSCE